MNNKFSKNLKKIRKDNNLSQEQLAFKLGVSRQAISKWESSTAYPEMDKIITLCEEFNLNIDDLLHKDIKEVKEEEESKKNINRYVDDFLNFITNTVDMFSNMGFKSKCKCLFEQFVIGTLLLVICLIIGVIGDNLLYAIFDIMPNKLFKVFHSLFYFIYVLFALISSVIIIVHIFKTRYLDYYDKAIKNVTVDKLDEKLDNIDYNKIIIRDPKHSEYKFINGLFKTIVGIIKFFVICFSLILFISLISLFCLFILSFLIIKTGLLFIGLLFIILFSSVINIVLILILLNFVFNRKNDKKKMILSFVISLIMIGIGSGLVLVGALDFEYIKNDKDILKTKYIEIDMNDDLVLNNYQDIEYVVSDNDNIKIEYTINKYCDINYSNLSNNVIHLWSSCDNPIKIVKEVINNFNDKKIISMYGELQDIKIYSSKRNIEVLKENYKNYIDSEAEIQSSIDFYENRINELEEKMNEYIEKELEYQEEINELKDEIFMYQSCNESSY